MTDDNHFGVTRIRGGQRISGDAGGRMDEDGVTTGEGEEGGGRGGGGGGRGADKELAPSVGSTDIFTNNSTLTCDGRDERSATSGMTKED